MDLAPEVISSELKYFEDEIVSAKFYNGTQEGVTHEKNVTLLRGMYTRIGLFSEDAISKAFRRAELRIAKASKREK